MATRYLESLGMRTTDKLDISTRYEKRDGTSRENRGYEWYNFYRAHNSGFEPSGSGSQPSGSGFKPSGREDDGGKNKGRKKGGGVWKVKEGGRGGSRCEENGRKGGKGTGNKYQ